MRGMRAMVLVAVGVLPACRVGFDRAFQRYRIGPERSLSQVAAGKRAYRSQVEVSFGPGKLAVRRGEGAGAVQVVSKSNVAELEPVVDQQEWGRDLRVEVRPRRGPGSAPLWDWEDVTNEWDVSLTDHLPIDLGFDLGVCEAEMDLGGLALSSVRIDVGAADLSVDFSAPNRQRMSRMTVDAGASHVVLERLGNAGFDELEFSGGVGDFVLDLSGEWREPGRIDLEAGLCSIELRVPSDLPVRVVTHTDLGDVAPDGSWARQRGGWVNAACRERGEAWVEVVARVSLGGMELNEVDRRE